MPRPALNIPAKKRPRPKLDQTALLRGWERQDAQPGEAAKYAIYLVCYDRHGFLRERHGFHDEASMKEFCAVHPAPKG